VPLPDGERIARLEQAQDDLRGDIEDLRKVQRDDHHRLRGVEDAVSLILQAQKEARRAEALQYQRLTLAVQWGGIALGFGMFALALVTAFFHH
jgi:hypothetical protein